MSYRGGRRKSCRAALFSLAAIGLTSYLVSPDAPLTVLNTLREGHCRLAFLKYEPSTLEQEWVRRVAPPFDSLTTSACGGSTR